MPTALFLLYNEISQVWQMSYIQQVNAAYLTDYLILCPIHTRYIMAIPVMEFQVQGYKIRKIFCLKINIPKRKLLNFENWCSGVKKCQIICHKSSESFLLLTFFDNINF